MTRIVVGDVGGTNARLGIAKQAEKRIVLETVEQLPVLDFLSFEDALASWIEPAELDGLHAVFAVAGPTGASEVQLTNANWVISADALKARFGFSSVTLINDFAAQARAIPVLDDGAFETLILGIARKGSPIVVLGPGTGLGLALLMPDRQDWRVIPTEGGHQAFAPADERERTILSRLTRGETYISFEHLVSGMGLECIYRALGAMNGERGHLTKASEIGQAACSGTDGLAIEAAETLSLMLATFAGNAVLANGAQGGCVIAGGVANALAPFLRTPEFSNRFQSRGVMSTYFTDLPLRRILDPFAALKGAALFSPTE